MSKDKKILAALIIVGIAIGISAFTYLNNMLDKPVDPVVEQQPAEENEAEESQQPAYVAPLTGTPVDKPVLRRPIAITVENSPGARPQSGLKDADLVYEVLAEGGITRFLAIYHNNDTDNVGPIRSARDYLAYMSHDYDGVFVHVGGSPGGLAYVGQSSVANLNAFFIATGEFWRTKDRKAPHNLYSKTSEIRKLMVKQGYERDKEISGWPYLAPDQEFAGTSAPSLKIFYPSAVSVVEYQYVPELKVYARNMGGKPHIDRESGLQLAAKNIIVQFADTKVIDGEGRLSINLTGSGKALVFSGGKVIDAKWTKKDNRSRTVFTDANGAEIALAPGQTWIQIVRTDTKVEY